MAYSLLPLPGFDRFIHSWRFIYQFENLTYRIRLRTKHVVRRTLIPKPTMITWQIHKGQNSCRRKLQSFSFQNGILLSWRKFKTFHYWCRCWQGVVPMCSAVVMVWCRYGLVSWHWKSWLKMNYFHIPGRFFDFLLLLIVGESKVSYLGSCISLWRWFNLWWRHIIWLIIFGFKSDLRL